MSILKEISRVIRSKQYVLGNELKALENEVQRYLGVKYAIGVNSGTDALLISLRALGIRRGDEVITSPFTFVATSQSIANLGAIPVFVDIGEDLNINVNLIEEAITERTKCILPVNLFGKQADLRRIKSIARKYRLKVLEDSAQAFGLPLEGDMASISFYPTKKLGGMGDGGMIITNSKKLADKCFLLRNHGSDPKFKYNHLVVGYNSRLDEIQAAVLRYKLKSLPKYFSYDKSKYYPIPLHLQPCFAYLGYQEGDLPQAEKEATRVALQQHIQVSKYRKKHENRQLCRIGGKCKNW